MFANVPQIGPFAGFLHSAQALSIVFIGLVSEG